MSVNRQIRTDIHDAMEEWSRDEQDVFLFLLTNSLTNICGFYRISISTIAGYKKMEREAVKIAMKGLEDRGQIVYDSQLLFIPDYAEHQGAWDYREGKGLGYFHAHVLRTAAEHHKSGNRAWEAFAERNRSLIDSAPLRKSKPSKGSDNPLPKGLRNPSDNPLDKGSDNPLPKGLDNPATRVNNNNYNNRLLLESEGGVGETNLPHDLAKPLADGEKHHSEEPPGGAHAAGSPEVRIEVSVNANSVTIGAFTIPRVPKVSDVPQAKGSNETEFHAVCIPWIRGQRPGGIIPPHMLSVWLNLWREHGTVRLLWAFTKFVEGNHHKYTMIEDALKGELRWDYAKQNNRAVGSDEIAATNRTAPPAGYGRRTLETGKYNPEALQRMKDMLKPPAAAEGATPEGGAQ